MWINKFGILAINQKSLKDITEGILFHRCLNLTPCILHLTWSGVKKNFNDFILDLK